MGMIPEGVYCFDIDCNLIEDDNLIRDECYQMYIIHMNNEIFNFMLNNMKVFTVHDADYTGFWFRDAEDNWYNVTKIKNECLKGIN